MAKKITDTSYADATACADADELLGIQGGAFVRVPRSLLAVPAGGILAVGAAANGTAASGRLDHPYSTVAAAQTAAVSGDCIVGYPGSFALTSALSKNGLRVNLIPGATWTLTNDGVTDLSLIDDGGAARTLRVDGRGVLVLAGTLTTAGSPTVVHVSHASSDVRVRAETMTLSANDDTDSGLAWVVNVEAGNCVVDADRIEVTATAYYSAINWLNGAMNVHAREIVTGSNAAGTGAPGAFVSATLTTPTGDAYLNVDHVQCQSPAITTSGNQAEAKVWVQSVLIEGKAGTVSKGDAGKLYMTSQKVVDNGGSGVGVAAFSQSGGKSWLTVQKFTGTYGSGIVISGGTAKISALEVEDLGHLTQGVLVSGGDLTLTGCDITAAIGNCVTISGGKLRLRSCKLDATASTGGYPVSVSGGTLILENCTLLAHSGQDCVTAGTAKTITNYGSVANTAKSANVTVNVQAILVDSNVV